MSGETFQRDVRLILQNTSHTDLYKEQPKTRFLSSKWSCLASSELHSYLREQTKNLADSISSFFDEFCVK
jgi:hypothetical protein